MTGSFDRELAAWLQADGPADVSNVVVDDALAAARRIAQRGPLQLGVRGPAAWPDGGTASRAVGRVYDARPLVLLAAALVVAVIGAMLVVGTGSTGTRALLVWTSFDTGGGVLHQLRADGSLVASVELPTAVGCAHPLPDGKRIAYSPGSGWSTRDLATGSTRSIAGSGGFDPFLASWSPDGWRIVSRAGMIVDFRDDSVRQVPEIGRPDSWVAWTPTGALGYSFVDGSQAKIIVLEDDGVSREIARWAWDPEKPPFGPEQPRIPIFDWSPDGRYILHLSDSNAVEVIAVDTRTGSSATIGDLLPVPLQPTAASDHVGWSPDGTRVALYDPEGHMVIARLDGSDQTAIPFDTEPVGSPTWSPDGNWIAVGTLAELVTLRADGSGRIARPGLPGRGPIVWSDDSSLLAVRTLLPNVELQVDLVEPARVEPVRSTILATPDNKQLSDVPQEQCLSWLPEE